MPRRAILRASDADREAVAERLRKATAEGRLLAEELEHRLERAFCARTYGDLDPLVADIPEVRDSRRPRDGLSRLVVAGAGMAVAAIVVMVLLAVALVIVTGLFAGWALWLLAGWWFFARGRRHRGRQNRIASHGRSAWSPPRSLVGCSPRRGHPRGSPHLGFWL